MSPYYSILDGGEISPRLGARVDLATYHTAAAAIENFIVLPEVG